MTTAKKATTTAATLNPAFSECQCHLAEMHRLTATDVYGAQPLHDALLGLDGPQSLRAFGEVLRILLSSELPEGFDPTLFMFEHSWTDAEAAVSSSDDHVIGAGTWLTELISDYLVPIDLFCGIPAMGWDWTTFQREAAHRGDVLQTADYIVRAWLDQPIASH